jgi:hypothetical protein
MSHHSGNCRSGIYRPALLGMVALLLQACSGSDLPQLPPQQWQDLSILLETRPVQVRPGMNEFLIIATTPRGLPGDDMVVSLRMSNQDAWSQAIQDGHSGVFRRAIIVNSGQRNVFVQLKRRGNSGVLTFPLLVVD